MTAVVNVRFIKDRRHIAMIDRTTIFGNPYVMGPTMTRNESISYYREWFYKKLEDRGFAAAVELLRGKILGCWCKPLACHGDVIVEYLDEDTKS